MRRWNQNKKSEGEAKYDESYHKKYSFISKCSESVTDCQFKFHSTACDIDLIFRVHMLVFMTVKFI